MNQILGKTVYVLGAGASCHTGAPLLKDFLITSRILMKGGGELTDESKKHFKDVFYWIEKMRGSSYYVELDLDNLEHIFSLAEMRNQLKLEEGGNIVKALKHIIWVTLDKTCEVPWKEAKIQPDEAYDSFVENLNKLEDKRRKAILKSEETLEKDVIITFNYDVELDFALHFRTLGPDYCLSDDCLNYKTEQTFIKLLKLHGSMNWGECSACKDRKLQVIDPEPYVEGRLISHGEQERKFKFNMVFGRMKHTELRFPNCHHSSTTLEPILIPPTWSKYVKGSPLSYVWSSAVKELKTAFQIVVIGYSMPSTDTFFQYLLTLGLSSNDNLYRVVVINPDNRSPEFRKRYEDVFSRSLKDRNRILFLSATDFKNYITSDMEAIGSEIELPKTMMFE